MPAPAGKVLTRYSFSMQIILKNSLNNTFFTLEFDPINNWYFANWIGYASPENVKEGALRYLELMKEKPSAFLLNNNQELVGPWEKANDWLENVWIPQARELGLKYMAHILRCGYLEKWKKEKPGCAKTRRPNPILSKLFNCGYTLLSFNLLSFLCPLTPLPIFTFIL